MFTKKMIYAGDDTFDTGLGNDVISGDSLSGDYSTIKLLIMH